MMNTSTIPNEPEALVKIRYKICFCNVRFGLCRTLANYSKGHFDLHPDIFAAR